MRKEIKFFLSKYKFIFLLLLATFILRLPSLLEPYWYGDEGIYMAIGVALRNGYSLYRDIFDNKPPLIYLLTAFANGSQFWFRFLLMSSILPTIYFFYQLNLIIFQKNKRLSQISTIIFAGLTTFRFWEGNIANAELFILLPTIIGIYLFWQNRNSSRNYLIFFSIGAIMALGFLLKAIALFDFAALFIFLVLFSGKKIFVLGKRELFFLAGYLTPIIITGVYFAFRGTFAQFYSACFLQMFGYLSSWETGTHAFSLINLLKSELVIKFVIVSATIFIFWLKRKHFSAAEIFSFLWFTLALFSATLSGRPYPHYLVQIIPPLCLLGIQILNKNKKQIILATISGIFLFLALVRYHFWSYPTVSYYRNFLEFSLGRKNKTQYFNYFNPNLENIYKTAEFIQANSNPEDKLFVWANEPYLYVLSKRLPATPYVVAYHITDLGNTNLVVNKLQQNSPKIIVIDNQLFFLPQLKTVLDNQYLKLQQINNFTIYRHRMLLSPLN